MELHEQQEQKKRKSILTRCICVLIALLLMIGISTVVALIVHKNGKSVPASTTVQNGLSAYELAVQYGYDGTVQEWLNSLSGKSAYDIAKENGYSGTEQEWIASIEATANQDNAGIKTAAFSEDGDLLLTLTDNRVINVGKAAGSDGHDGDKGEAGEDGIGISEANINEDGQLVLEFSDGNIVNLDKVVGSKGNDGVGVSSSAINEDGELVLSYTNGQTVNLGNVIGAKGDKGDTGEQGIQGIQGDKGDDGISIISSAVNKNGELVLTYSDGNVVNLGHIIGDKGDTGEAGANGIGVVDAEIASTGELVLTYSNGQKDNLGNVIGAKGDKGDTGAQGIQGIQGDKGADGKDGISVTKSEINQKGELVLTYSDNRVQNLGVVIGAQGEKGDTGAQGEDGVGIQTIIITGNNELEITLTNGTTLNLGNIKGEKGDKGDTGAAGVAGADGKDGIGITETSINEFGELILTYSDGETMNLGKVVGEDGAQGEKGDTGSSGADGKDGIGVTATEINESGELIITYSNGNAVNLGVVIGKDGAQGEKGDTGATGADGEDGVGITETTINAAGELVLTYSNGEIVNLGKVVGEDGAQGEKGDTGSSGADGKDGIGIVKTEINEKGEFIVTYSNGNVVNLGVIVGKDGEKGETGAQGEKGEKGDKGETGSAGADGEDGIGISKAEINDSGELVLTFSNSTSINLGCIVGQDGAQGEKGEKGETGAQGEKGDTGADGIGIADVTITEEGALNVTLTNGTILQLGNIRGEDGIGISKAEINTLGELILTDTDGKTTNLGKVVGDDGKDGEDGIGIKTVTLSTDGQLSVTLSDNTVISVGNVKGEKGDKGDTGAQGEKGEKGDKGDDGRGILKTEYIDGVLIITYTDGTKDEFDISTGNQYEDYCVFDLLPDGTYAVSLKQEYKTIQIEKLVIPSRFNGKPVSTIKKDGFYGNYIESIVIPGSVTSVEERGFSDSKKLKTVTFLEGEEPVIIEKNAFANTTTLSEITFSSNIQLIKSSAFLRCLNIKSAYFNDPVGWRCKYFSGYQTTTEAIPSETLSNPSEAAKILNRDTTSSETYEYTHSLS